MVMLMVLVMVVAAVLDYGCASWWRVAVSYEHLTLPTIDAV